MRIRMLLQVGAFHKPAANSNVDLLQLQDDPTNILNWAMNEIKSGSIQLKQHVLADGTPHLLEFETIVDKDPEVIKEEK